MVGRWPGHRSVRRTGRWPGARGTDRFEDFVAWVLTTCAAGVVLLVRRRAVVWPLLAPIVTVSVVSVLTYGSQRFRVSADPMLAVLAAVTICTIATAASTTSATSAGARNLTAP